MQSIPLAVLKQARSATRRDAMKTLHAIHTACGIETTCVLAMSFFSRQLHAIHTACGIETSF